MPELSVYASEVDGTWGSCVWAIFRQDGDRLRRVNPVSDWLYAMRVAMSPNTVGRRARSLSIWWRWCIDTDRDPLCPTVVDFSDYVAALQETPRGRPLASNLKALPGDSRLRAASTVQQRVQDVQEFYRWTTRQDSSPVPRKNATQVATLKAPTAPSGGRAPRLEPQQVKAMQTAQMHPRDRLLVELGHGAGLRAGEALGMWVEDVHTTGEVAEVFGCRQFDRFGPHLHVRQRPGLSNRARAKGPAHAHTPRVVPLTRRLMLAYGEWHWWCSQHMPDAVNSRFVLLKLSGKNRGRPWDYNAMWERWHERISNTPGLEGAWPHLLRHTFASELADAGVERAVISELLGHRNPSSTDIYLHQLASSMVDAVATLGQWRRETIGVQ